MTIHPFFAPSVHLSLLSKVHQNGEAGKVDIRIQFFQMQIRCDVSLGGMLIDRTYRNIGFRSLDCHILAHKKSSLIRFHYFVIRHIFFQYTSSHMQWHHTTRYSFPKKRPNQTATVTCPTLVIAKITLEMPATPAEPDKSSESVVFKLQDFGIF